MFGICAAIQGEFTLNPDSKPFHYSSLVWVFDSFYTAGKGMKETDSPGFLHLNS
jgi:hypothetical protein